MNAKSDCSSFYFVNKLRTDCKNECSIGYSTENKIWHFMEHTVRQNRNNNIKSLYMYVDRIFSICKKNVMRIFDSQRNTVIEKARNVI